MDRDTPRRTLLRELHATTLVRPVLAICLATLAGCLRTGPAPASADAWVSSDSSLYTPSTRFRVRVGVEADRVVVAVDSGVVTIPGEAIPGTPPLMSDLYLSAILAIPDSTSLATVGGMRNDAPQTVDDRRGWQPVATSDSVLLARELHYGDRVPMPAVRLTIPGSFAGDPRTLWLIFRIAGNAVELIAPAVAGGAVQRRDLPGGVRVYACGDRDVFGRLDVARARALKKAYGIAC